MDQRVTQGPSCLPVLPWIKVQHLLGNATLEHKENTGQGLVGVNARASGIAHLIRRRRGAWTISSVCAYTMPRRASGIHW